MSFLKSRPQLALGVVVAIFSLFFAQAVFAQGVPNWASSLNLNPSTNSPAPGEQVAIELESHVMDLDSANIIWVVDGKEFGRGVGKKMITVTAPALGKSTRVTATAIAPDGQRLSNNIVIGSGDIDLIIETSGYLPPFFKGKVPSVYQNIIKVVTVPHLADSTGKEYDPKTLVYQWRKDWQALPDQSGYGRQSIEMVGDIIPRPYILSVAVSTRDGRIRSEKYMSIESGQASVTFYKDDPLYGPLFNKALGQQFNLGSSREASILAVPFGFDKPTDSLGSLDFSWLVNGLVSPELANNQSVTLRAPEGQSGSAVVNLRIKNMAQILQGVGNGFTAVFSGQSGSRSTAGEGETVAGSETF